MVLRGGRRREGVGSRRARWQRSLGRPTRPATSCVYGACGPQGTRTQKAANSQAIDAQHKWKVDFKADLVYDQTHLNVNGLVVVTADPDGVEHEDLLKCNEAERKLCGQCVPIHSEQCATSALVMHLSDRSNVWFGLEGT